MTEIRQPIDKREARRSFERRAAAYDQIAVLQREVGRRLLERLDLVHLRPDVILDVGAGTGALTAQLGNRFRRAQLVAVDFAWPMLALARTRGLWWRRPRCVCGDAEQLPLRDCSVDLVFSNLTLQWCNDLERTFGELLRVLKPGGCLMFSTFGTDTLRELRESWAEVDADPHVSQFPDLHDVGDAMFRARFGDPVVDMEKILVTYQELGTLLRDIKGMGAHNASTGRPRGLTGKKKIRAFEEAYERRRSDGVLPATYEVVYGHAWAPLQREAAGQVAVSLEILRRPRSSAG